MTEESDALKQRVADIRAQLETVIEAVTAAAIEVRERVENRLREAAETLDDIVADLEADRAEGDEVENGEENT
jgi:ElaB/YqjD/DUF883 family membrane-anchored ribosome-binding protein